MSTYRRLAEFLDRKPGTEWEASFHDIEKVLGRALPPSAYRHQAWWANAGGADRAQAKGWRTVGWRTAKLDLERKRVRFERERSIPVIPSAKPLSSADELLARAASLTGITDRNALVQEALRALIQREIASCLIAAGGSAPNYEPAARERPPA